MMSDDNVSQRIAILRLPLIAGIVFFHNCTTTFELASESTSVTQNRAWVDFVRYFISLDAALVAIPMFFLISGYLFFLGEWSRERYVSKLKRRVHTLLIPFLFWNLFTLLVLAVGQSIPQVSQYFFTQYYPPIHSFSCLNYINALSGIAIRWPIAGHFWFIRDLMAVVVLAPVIHFLLSNKKWGILFLVILVCLRFAMPSWPDFWPGFRACFFFTLGAYLSQHGKSIMCLDKFGPWICTVFLGLIVFQSAFPHSPKYLEHLVVIFGLPSVWWLSGLVAKTARLKSLLIALGSSSFFVFAAHEPLQGTLIKVTHKLFLPSSGVVTLALYFSIPLCVIALLVTLYHCLLKTMPSFLDFIAGSSHRFRKQRG